MNVQEDTSAEGMLQPYRVLDLTDEKGFLCGKLLGDLGADVVKIERPGGDAARHIGPFFHDIPDPERSLFWLALNASKRGITLDIETHDGQDIFRQLAKSADVVIESSCPGYLDGLGLGYRELSSINRQIIMVSLTPFGQTGPYSAYKGADIVCWALGGKLLLTGDADRPPVQVSQVPHAWLHGSADAAAATAMALYRRTVSGKGQHLDISIQESVEKVAYLSHLTWTLAHREAWRGGVMRTPPFNTVTYFVWPCKDGYIVFYPFTGPMGPLGTRPVVDYMDEEGMADDFIKGIDWAAIDWGQTPQAEADKISARFRKFFQTKTKDELFAEAIKRPLLIQPVCTSADVMKNIQLQAREYWQRIANRESGEELIYPGGFVKASETSCAVRRRAPLIGEHNDEIYGGEQGLPAGKLNKLKEGRII
ncbi:MAG: hypothetical protein FJ008_05540 [Chloroflexi bacterium]|nr:hypothetical protein [Chloroflexota bacterium]MBM3174934.1 hypothetical protein [Chloroflexota bacterium]